MATRAEPSFATKKKITTYGKVSRNRSLPSGFSSYGKDLETVKPIAWSPNTPLKSDEDGKENSSHATSSATPDDRTASQSVLKPSKEARIPMKRKPSQAQAASRQTKKQRSSSPDSPPVSQHPARTAATGGKTSSAAPKSKGPTTPPNDTLMTNVPDTTPFSPDTFKVLGGLSVSSQKSTIPQRQIPFRPPSKVQAKYGSTMKDRVGVIADAKKMEKAPTAQPRRRLIDALAAQAEQSSEEEDDDEPEKSQQSPQQSRASPVDDVLFSLDRASPAPFSPEPSRPTMRQKPLSTKKPGVKFTYSQQRTMLAEDPMDALANSGDDFLMSQPLLPPSQSNLSAFSMDDEDDDGTNKGAVLSLHELRQSGANNRFADELDDIMRGVGTPSVGKPSSMRRNALLDLSKKLQDKTFLRLFRSHNGESTLFRGAGRETDVIAGYTLTCIQILLLAGSTASHLIPQLQSQGVSNLLALLLATDVDIATIAKDRKSNVSRHGQMLLSGLKKAILEQDVWESPQSAPTTLSPRTVALKCLELIVKQSRTVADGNEVITLEVAEQLFRVLSSATDSQDSSYWDFPNETDSVDLYLALSLLEMHSVWAMQSRRSSQWTGQYMSIIAGILQTSLRHESERFGHLECLTLKLTLNTTNNNIEAQKVFLDRGLLRELVTAVCGTFDVVHKSISSDDFLSTALDSLLLMLGAMINFSEHDPSACRSLVQKSGATSLDRLIKIFLDNRATTAEMNVAFGYLSVLLGYLCLYDPIRERFTSLHSGRNLDPLLGSIREFIAFHKAADHAIEMDGASTSATERLQSLVDQLESRY